MSQLLKSPTFINCVARSKIALAQTRLLVPFVLLALSAVSPVTSESLNSKACDSCDSDEEADDNQAFLQHSTTDASKKPLKESMPFKIVRKVGACRQDGGQKKIWFGKVRDVGNRTAAECWDGCQEGAYRGFGNDGHYTWCYCTWQCKCLTAAGVSNVLVPANFSGRLPSVCTDCPQIAGTYNYTGPSSDPKGILEVAQKGCVGIVSGRGRFTSLRDNAGLDRIVMQTAYGATVANHGKIMKKGGLTWVYWDDGYIFQAHVTGTANLSFWGWRRDSPASRLDGWDALGTTDCAAGARLFRGRPIPGPTGGYGKSSILHCADYATTNEATMFSYSSCPPPRQRFELHARRCPGRGNSRCLNGNRAYHSFSEAWSACGLVEGCGIVMKWLKGKYFLRRSTDPVYQGRNKNLRTASLGIPYHCPEEMKRCNVWNACARVIQDSSFSSFQVACPSASEVCSGNAEMSIGCPEPLCDIPPVPEWN